MSNLMELSAIPIREATVGDYGTVWDENHHRGQGGKLLCVFASGTAVIENPFQERVVFEDAAAFVPRAAEEEQDDMRLKAWADYESGEGRQFEFDREDLELAYDIGWSEACRYGLRNDRDSMARYADSDVAPDWFDPADAGESWDGE